MTAIAELNRHDAKRQLPDGWQWVTLESVVTPHNAFWGADEPFGDSTEALVLGVGNITNEGHIKLEGAPKRYLAHNETEGIAFEGDLLVVKSSGSASNIRSGKTGLCPAELSGRIACSNFMIRLAVKRDEAEPYLLWLILNSEAAKTFVRSIAGSTTYPNIKWSSYKGFSFPLPPPMEQKRIAGILNEQMAAVKRARRSAEAQLQAAEALPAAYLSTVFKSAEAQQWPGKPFGDLVENCDGRRVPVNLDDRRNKKGSYPYYGASGIIDYVDDYLFDGEYLLIGEDGANLVLRSSPIAFKASGKFWVNNHAHVVQPRGGVPLDYLLHFFAVTDLKPYVTGAAQPKLTQGDLNSISVPVPPLADQQRIAEQLSLQMASAERLRQTLADQLETINKLPAALLRRAFNGEL